MALRYFVPDKRPELFLAHQSWTAGAGIILQSLRYRGIVVCCEWRLSASINLRFTRTDNLTEHLAAEDGLGKLMCLSSEKCRLVEVVAWSGESTGTLDVHSLSHPISSCHITTNKIQQIFARLQGGMDQEMHPFFLAIFLKQNLYVCLHVWNRKFILFG